MLHIQPVDGPEKTYSLGSDEHIEIIFERLSPEDIHIGSKTRGQAWILHLDESGSQISELPGKPQPAASASEAH